MGAVKVGAEAIVNLALSTLALFQTAPAVSQVALQKALAVVSQFPVPPQGVVAPLTSQIKVAASDVFAPSNAQRQNRNFEGNRFIFSLRDYGRKSLGMSGKADRNSHELEQGRPYFL